MKQKVLSPPESERRLARRVADLKKAFRRQDPQQLALQTGATFTATGPEQGQFFLPFWDREIVVVWPDFIGRLAGTGEPLSMLEQGILTYYFCTADGTPTTGKWIAFTELADGRFYTRAFQGYTGQELAKTFGNDLDRFGQACLARHGRAESLGDLAFAFDILPRVKLLAVAWAGDEEFAPSYRILFDTAVNHYLPTDACAILGSLLTRQLLQFCNKELLCS